MVDFGDLSFLSLDFDLLEDFVTTFLEDFFSLDLLLDFDLEFVRFDEGLDSKIPNQKESLT